jgi:hypothetical protein
MQRAASACDVDRRRHKWCNPPILRCQYDQEKQNCETQWSCCIKGCALVSLRHRVKFAHHYCKLFLKGPIKEMGNPALIERVKCKDDSFHAPVHPFDLQFGSIGRRTRSFPGRLHHANNPTLKSNHGHASRTFLARDLLDLM